MSALLRALRLPFAVMLLAASTAAARKPVIGTASDAPSWLREAAARPLAPTSADAVVLLDDLRAEPLPGGGVRLTQRWVGRALAPAGLATAVHHSVQYGEDDVVESVDAWSLGADGTLRRIDRDDDVVDAPLVVDANTIYDERIRAVTVPGVTVGSTVGFESRIVARLDGESVQVKFGEPDLFVAEQRLAVELPAGWTLKTVAQGAEGVERAATEHGVTFVAHDLAPLPREPWQPPAAQLLPRVRVTWRDAAGARGFADWAAVGRWYRDLAAAAMTDAGEAAAISTRLRPAEPAQLASALERAFAFASHDVRYVAIELGIGGYKPATPAASCTARYGDCKAKSFLLRSLVDPWGVKAWPVLVRTRQLGSVDEDAPTPAQFNHCIAAVALPDDVAKDAWNVAVVPGVGRVGFFDATDSAGSAWSLPSGDQGTLGLLVHPDGARLVRLPVQPPEAGAIRCELRAALSDSGAATEATLVETWSGSEAGGARARFRRLDDTRRAEAAREDLQERLPGATLVEQRVEGLDDVAVQVTTTTRVSGGRLGKRAVDLLIVQPDAVGRGISTGKLPPPPRRWPVELGRPHEEGLDVALEVPAGWGPESMPEPWTVTSAHLSATGGWRQADGKLHYARLTRVLSATVPPADYDAFRDALGRIRANDSQGVVLVQAASP